MDQNQIIKNQMQLEALSDKFDSMIQNIEKLNEIIKDNKPTVKEGQTTFTVRDVAKMAGLSPVTVQKDIDRGILNVVHRGDRKRVLADSAKEYINPKK